MSGVKELWQVCTGFRMDPDGKSTHDHLHIVLPTELCDLILEITDRTDNFRFQVERLPQGHVYLEMWEGRGETSKQLACEICDNTEKDITYAVENMISKIIHGDDFETNIPFSLN